MFRFMRINTVVICFMFFGLISCVSHDKKAEQEYTESEILSYFIKQKTGIKSANGSFVFVCGPICKGCVQQTLLQMDSTYHTLSSEQNYTFFTSHESVMQLALQNIKFLFDPKWDEVNFDFEDVTIVKFINDSIVSSRKIY